MKLGIALVVAPFAVACSSAHEIAPSHCAPFVGDTVPVVLEGDAEMLRPDFEYATQQWTCSTGMGFGVLSAKDAPPGAHGLRVRIGHDGAPREAVKALFDPNGGKPTVTVYLDAGLSLSFVSFRTMAMHEMGHWLGMGHTERGVMQENGGAYECITDDDIAKRIGFVPTCL